MGDGQEIISLVLFCLIMRHLISCEHGTIKSGLKFYVSYHFKESEGVACRQVVHVVSPETELVATSTGRAGSSFVGKATGGQP